MPKNQTRKFGNKEYILCDSFTHRRDAVELAEGMRRVGNFARIILVGRNNYSVYIRRKK